MRAKLALLLILTAASAAAQTNVIVSTDMAMGLNGGWRSGWSDADDAWALALAWKTLNVRAVEVTFGNNDVEPEMRSLRTLLEAAGRKTPFARGAAVKLTDPQVSLGGKAMLNACENDAVRHMAAALRRQQATVVAIGPLTDIACLVLNAPKTA